MILELLISFLVVSVFTNIVLSLYIRKIRQTKVIVPLFSSAEPEAEAETPKPQVPKLEINPFQPETETKEERQEEVLVPVSLPPILELTPQSLQEPQLHQDENIPPKPEESVGTTSAVPTVPLYQVNVDNPEACEYCGKTGLRNKGAHQRNCKKRLGIP